ncbi:MAG: putative transport system permease protein, partial [Actinomycetota bacterium]|nr:putative transport system permease protein [Actinomycetota bacterium]
MSAMWMRFRADLRRRVWAFVALGVLAGIAGGVVLTAAAGARRTDTALARWVRHSNAADVLVNPDNTPGPKWSQVDHLPHVAAVGSLEGIAVENLVNGQLDPRWLNTLVGGATDARLFRTVHRERIVDGRLFDPRAVDEVVINERMVRERGYHVGSRLTLQVFTQPELDQLMNNGHPKGRAMRFVVSG